MNHIVLGTGPRAWSDLQKIYTGQPIVTCNGGLGLCKKLGVVPKLYALIEYKAILHYMHEVPDLLDAGCQVFTNWHDKCHFPKEIQDKLNTVGFKYVYDRKERDYFWMTTGVLLLMICAKEFAPPRIDVCGINGYDVADNYSEHAEYVPEMDARNPEWCRMSNRRASKHVGKITNIFRETEFVWHGGTGNFDTEDWRVTEE